MIVWTQNSTHLQLPVTLQTASGVVLDLTGVANNAITIKIRPASQSSAYTTLVGTATITTANAGKFSYKFSVADVAIAGNYKLVVSVSYGAGDVWNSYEQDFVISQAT